MFVYGITYPYPLLPSHPFVTPDRWTAIGWPHKIEVQMEQTYNQLEEDEERFRKLQSSDQANFNDRLDTLQVRSCLHLFSFSYHVLPYYPKNNFKEIADSLTDFEFINISALRYKSLHIRHEPGYTTSLRWC